MKKGESEMKKNEKENKQETENEKKRKLTFISVGQDDSWHKFFLAVRIEGISNHNLILGQLALEVQGIPPIEFG